MSLARRLFGQKAESAAEQYLRRQGYRIRERNVRSSYGELDLVVERAGVLVFVEVKARRTDSYGGAPYAVDARKQTRIIRLAAQYLARAWPDGSVVPIRRAALCRRIGRAVSHRAHRECLRCAGRTVAMVSPRRWARSMSVPRHIRAV